MKTDKITAERFLRSLYPDEELPGKLVLWTLPNKQSHWFGSAEAAAEALDHEHDWFFGACLQGKKPKANGSRGTAASVAAIPGWWADVDWTSDASPKQRFATREDALLWVRTLPLQPSIIVDSGHGLHLYWLFRELWIVESAEERQVAASASTGWQGWLRISASAAGATLDSTADLARVLRVPGTWNLKQAPVPVSVVEFSERRYNPSDFEEYALNNVTPLKPLVTEPGHLVLRADAEPPHKYEVLKDNDPKFAAALKGRRPDLTDQSQSGYDLALACACVKAGWTDQETLNLLLWNRAQKRAELKLDRPDYYNRTLGRARTSTQEAAIQGNLPAEAEEAVASGDKAKCLEKLSTAIKVNVVRVKKLIAAGEQATYILTITHGTGIHELSLKSMQLIDFKPVKERFLSCLGVVLSNALRKPWDSVMELIDAAADIEDLGMAASESGHTEELLRKYLAETPASEAGIDVLTSDCPYRDSEGAVWVISSGFVTWAARVHGHRWPNRKTLGDTLSKLGFTSKSITLTRPGDRGSTSRSGWRVPEGWA